MTKVALLALLSSSNAIKVTQQNQMLSHSNNALLNSGKLKSNVDADSEAKWGFLKNIVNIDTFFSNGAAADAPTKVVKEEAVEKIVSPPAPIDVDADEEEAPAVPAPDIELKPKKKAKKVA